MSVKSIHSWSSDLPILLSSAHFISFRLFCTNLWSGGGGGVGVGVGNLHKMYLNVDLQNSLVQMIISSWPGCWKAY